MKIAMTSDIHRRKYILNKLKYKKVDLLLVAGDLTNTGTQSELQEILNVINDLDITHKVVVLGNHDGKNSYNANGNGQKNYHWCKINYPNIHFLNNEIIDIEGLKIYGSPYCQKYWLWDFEYNKDNQSYLTLPKENVDIIVVHEPPQSELSYDTDYSIQIGNKSLLEYLQQDENRCKLLVGGHIHSPLMRNITINGTMCYNVSSDIYYTEL